MIELDPGLAARGTPSAGALIGRLAWLYLAGVLGLATLAYGAFVALAKMMPGRPAPLWQLLLAVSFGLTGAIPAWFAGKAYVRACRRGNIRPAAFGLRWLGGPLAIAMLTGVAFLFRARLLR